MVCGKRDRQEQTERGRGREGKYLILQIQKKTAKNILRADPKIKSSKKRVEESPKGVRDINDRMAHLKGLLFRRLTIIIK